MDQPDHVTVLRFTDAIHDHIPEAKLGRSHGKELNYTLPLSSVAQFAGACWRWQVRVRLLLVASILPFYCLLSLISMRIYKTCLVGCIGIGTFVWVITTPMYCV